MRTPPESSVAVEEQCVAAKALFAKFAAALRSADDELSAIRVPASIQPAVDAVLSDDAPIEAGLLRSANGNSCADYCTAYQQTAPAFAQRSTDVPRLRQLLGLP